MNKKMIAKKAIEDKDIPKALKLYEEILEEEGYKDQVSLAWYGKSLRDAGESLKFIDICRKHISNQRITSVFLKNILCWCIYDEYIKIFDENNTEKLDEFLKEAKYICNNTAQLSAEEYFKNPYVLTVVKVIQVYNNRNHTNYYKVLEWVEFLNPDILSEQTYQFTDSNGNAREKASIKEFYYQNKIKALEKTYQYNECSNLCEECFEKIKKFHYKNDIWIKSRKLFCDCMQNPGNIDAYVDFAQRKNLWHIYKKISDLCFRYNRIEEALIYGSKAIICSYENEKMVNLFFSMGQLFSSIGYTKQAKIMFHASSYYRKVNGWKISEELEYEIEKYSIDVDTKVNRREVENIAIEYLKEHKVIMNGKIIKILSNKNAGFIRVGNGVPDIYFKIQNVKGRDISKNMEVYFEVIEISERKQAINIRKRWR